MADEEKPMISLNDRRICPWEAPLPELTVSIHQMCGTYTLLKKFIGRDVLDTKAGPYHITASAAKYLADVMRVEGCPSRWGEERPDRTTEVLFSGGIAIYKEGSIEGTKIEGLELKTQGEIWFAEKPKQIELELVLNEAHTLKGIIFGHENSEIGKKERIEMIIRGYEHQAEVRERTSNEREFDSYRRGKLDALEHGGRWGPTFH